MEEYAQMWKTAGRAIIRISNRLRKKKKLIDRVHRNIGNELQDGELGHWMVWNAINQLPDQK